MRYVTRTPKAAFAIGLARRIDDALKAHGAIAMRVYKPTGETTFRLVDDSEERWSKLFNALQEIHPEMVAYSYKGSPAK